MNFVPVDKFLPRILPFAENLPEVVARRCVSDAAREMMDEALNVKLTYRFTTHAGEARYTLALPHGMSCVQCISGTVTEKGDRGVWQIRPTTAEVLDTYSYPIGWKDLRGTPNTYIFRSPDEIRLIPAPDKDGYEIAIECAATIRRDAEEVPEVLYEDFAETIADGALARALSMAGQTWSNPELGASYAVAFARGCAKARLEANKDFTRVSGVVSYNNWI